MDWEERYKTNDTPWEMGEPSPGLVEFLGQHPVTGRVLVPGCGFGHDVRAIAYAGAGKADVLGIDLASSAIQGARVLSACDAAGGHYEQGDLFALPPRYQGVFNWVFEHTCFCAIDPSLREQYGNAVADALKPHGRLLAVFFLNPERDPGEPADAGPPFGVSTAELDALFNPRFELLRDWLPNRAYPDREGRERMRLYVKKG